MGIRVTFVSAVFWLTFTVTGWSAQNLILNPGCEAAGNPLPSWTQVTGNWSCTVFLPSVPPQEGAAYFFAGNNLSAELRQDVSVSGSATIIDWGLATAAFSGYIQSWNQTPVDLSRIVVEYRNASNVLGSFDSGELSSVGSWMLLTDTRQIPAGTRTIRIRLISKRQEGLANDGYYDGLSLTVTIPTVSCYSDADCRLQSCGYDCSSCIALGSGDPMPPQCGIVDCSNDSCQGRVAICKRGKCVRGFP